MTPPLPTPRDLESCLIYVGMHLDRPITSAAIEAQRLGLEGKFGPREAMDLAARGGIQAAFGARPLDQLDNSLLPAILFLQDTRAVVLQGRDAAGQFLIYDPRLDGGADQGRRNFDLGTIDAQTLAQVYSGYAMSLRAAYRGDGAATDSGPSGHWLWSALLAHKWSYTQVILAATVANFLSLSTSIFVMVVYDRVLPNEAVESLFALSFGVALALIFDFVIRSLRAGFIDRAGQQADQVIARRIFDRLLDVQMSARTGSTGALSNTMREFETLRDFFTSATLVAVVDLPFILLFIGVIYLIGGPLAIVPALAVPFVIIMGVVIQPMLARLAAQSFADGQTKQAVLVETISGLETIKVVGAARQMRARWEHAVAQQGEHGFKSRAITQFAMNATAFAQQFAQVAIVFYGVFLILGGAISMGAMIASVMLTGRALAPLAQIAQTLTRINSVQMSYRALDNLMRAQSERPEGKTWLSRPQLAGQIDFDNVRFSYPNASVETLKGISFRIAAGEKVAILGRIGCGKSTVARMIAGLYQPSSGSVLVDQTDIRQIDPSDLRRNIGTMLQDVWLFSGSLRANIAIGSAHPQDEAVLAASRLAGVDEFAARHPQGYDMMLAERGEGLSGGQRQSIALARALIDTPSILLLDEPTSSMDVQTELGVIARLKASLPSSTLVVITHRPSLLDLVDRVIVIDDGRVVLDGPKALLSAQPQAQAQGGPNARNP
jgi:ATP-binding cassette, subfamily C, bacterial LapB